ncbi:MAG: hypothetical protein HQL49_13590 [Gammaproteobacteria bacterium]|nr:hypothetical protein [Gammaproteobacteria bacterium]
MSKISFTRFSGSVGSRLTKSFTLNADQTITKESQPNFSAGTAETIQVESLQAFGDIVNGLQPHQCIATGIFFESTTQVVPQSQYRENGKAKPRTLEHMQQPNPGLLLFDYDSDLDMPEKLQCHSVAELMGKLAEAIPELQGVGYIGRKSSSGCVVRETDNSPYHSHGMHCYVVVTGVDLPILKERIMNRLWLVGLGYIKLACNGAMLERAVIDLAVISPERLIYEAAPQVGKGLKLSENPWMQQEGCVFSQQLSVTPDESNRVKQLIVKAKQQPELVAKSAELNTKHSEERAVLISKKGDLPLEKARQLVVTNPLDFQQPRLKSQDTVDIGGECITVSELLERGQALDGLSMPDPIEGRKYGTSTAKFYWNKGKNPCIHSFAHGLNTVYQLERESVSPTQPLDPGLFPNCKADGGPKATLPNLEIMLKHYEITANYNVISKQMQIIIPNSSGSPDNADNTAITEVVSFATLNNMSYGMVPNYLEAIANKNPVNPVADWIHGRVWDENDRLPEFYATLTTEEGYPQPLKETLLRRWLISAAAAALMPTNFRARGVLTLQGPQSIGKTAWVNRLVDDEMLRDGVILLDHHLDASNKDSLIAATSHWIVEIGELDSSLRKDMARLKGFLTRDNDSVRHPYARKSSQTPRRTVFCATVNDENFLMDNTGNTRWWTISVTHINYQHSIDMQQLFAQMAAAFAQGEPWWLTHEEESQLEKQNKQHRMVSPIREMILGEFDFNLDKEQWRQMAPIELLQTLEINNPTMTQLKECGAVLRELCGEPKKHADRVRWWVPIQKSKYS